MSDRATAVEKESRILLFADAIASGFAKRADLCHLASVNGWNLSIRQIDRYISQAKQIFKERTLADLDTTRRKRVRQLEHLAHVNYLAGNYTEVRHNIKLLADIEGIIESRFADKPEELPQLAVVSRFKEKWQEASGDN